MLASSSPAALSHKQLLGSMQPGASRAAGALSGQHQSLFVSGSAHQRYTGTRLLSALRSEHRLGAATTPMQLSPAWRGLQVWLALLCIGWIACVAVLRLCNLGNVSASVTLVPDSLGVPWLLAVAAGRRTPSSVSWTARPRQCEPQLRFPRTAGGLQPRRAAARTAPATPSGRPWALLPCRLCVCLLVIACLFHWLIG